MVIGVTYRACRANASPIFIIAIATHSRLAARPIGMRADQLRSLRQNQDTRVWIGVEGRNQNLVGKQELGNAAGWTVSNAQKDELGRVPKKEAALMKVRILRDNGVTVLLSERPNLNVAGMNQAVRLDVS